ncbi:MAG: preprotein translocase subunit SecE [Eubacteriales bacterium]|nr:preprotein translocase subunit SecE [Eubacteriales bacterium]
MAEEKKTSKKSDSKAKSGKKSDKKSDKKSKKNPFKSIAGFFKSVRSEGKKVNWPGAKEVLKNTVTVIIVIAIVSAVIYVIDLGLTSGMKGLKNYSVKLKETTTASETTTEPTSDEVLSESTVEESNESAE